MQQLEQFLFGAWKEKVTPNLCKKLYDSMENRMNLVIQGGVARILNKFLVVGNQFL